MDGTTVTPSTPVSSSPCGSENFAVVSRIFSTGSAVIEPVYVYLQNMTKRSQKENETSQECLLYEVLVEGLEDVEDPLPAG